MCSKELVHDGMDTTYEGTAYLTRPCTVSTKRRPRILRYTLALWQARRSRDPLG